MKKLLLLLCLGLPMMAGAGMSCSSKADKQREQAIADSLRKDSIAKQEVADSIAKAKKETEQKDAKIAFLKYLYKNIVFATNQTYESYAKKFKKHLSAKVAKALTDYDDGIDDGVGGPGQPANTEPQFYLLRYSQDWEEGGPEITYEYIGDNWFKVSIEEGDVNNVQKIRVESDKEDEEFFIITGLEIPMLDLIVK